MNTAEAGTPPRRPRIKVSKAQLAVFVLFAAAVSLIPSRFSVTITPSLDKRVFFISRDPQPDTLRKGDYVLLDMSSRYPGQVKPKSELAIKRISCVSGDILDHAGRDYFCNGEFLGTAKETALSGVALDAFDFEGAMPPGKIFLSAPHKDSFDSRYFGFVDLAEIKAKAIPLF